MINVDKFNNLLGDYKKDFNDYWWEREEFKWIAIKHFQDHWDINAVDFVSMLEDSLSNTGVLLAATHFFPRRMINLFAKSDPEAVRAMFINLYDESKDIYGRISKFISDSDRIKEEYNTGGWNQHFQTFNSISTYLWLRYPDKYYIYKYSIYKAVSKELEGDYLPTRGLKVKTVENSIGFYDQINKLLKADDELIEILKSNITNEHYNDPDLKTVTIDFGVYIQMMVNKRKKEQKENWYYPDYSPGLSKNDWLDLLDNRKVFTEESLEVVKRLKDFGGMATCTQLSQKYGQTVNFYNVQSSNLAMRVAEEKNINGPISGDKNKWWPILYEGKKADKDDPGQIYWKLRDELNKALDKYNLSDVDLYFVDENKNGNFWWLNANPDIWSFSSISVGESIDYTMYNKNGNKRRIFRNFEDAQIGDSVIGYESNPVKKAVCLLKIVDKIENEKISFEKVKQFVTPIDYQTLKELPELVNMEFFVNSNGTFFKLTSEEYNIIIDLITGEEKMGKNELEKYTKDDFLDIVYISEEDYDDLVNLLEHKKNIILQGPPGVGKTFMAQRLAYSIMGVKDDSKVKFVQFHQNYSYEDFIMGYKPIEDGFKLKNGIFYDFCVKAGNDLSNDYFFIIDEINRGNLSKIFGELLMLIEKDYRNHKVTLAYNGQPFNVPDNLYIIGMMNTADRSIAMIDYALRRRFSFYEVMPGFHSEGFIKYRDGLDDELFNDLLNNIDLLNKNIIEDSSLGKGFALGHSYFCNQDVVTEKWLKQVVEYEIIPMLNEYWFDEPDKLKRWENILRGIFNE